MTSSMRSALILLSAAIACAAGSGCGGGPKLLPVTGTVTLNGKPLENAEVSFIPDPSNPDPQTPGADRTGPEGNFKAKYNGRFGLSVGKYKVLISKKEAPPDSANLPEAIKVDRVQQEMMGIRKESLPKRYTEAAESTEFCEVKEVGDNIFDFDIKAKDKDAKK